MKNAAIVILTVIMLLPAMARAKPATEIRQLRKEVERLQLENRRMSEERIKERTELIDRVQKEVDRAYGGTITYINAFYAVIIVLIGLFFYCSASVCD